jgi:hypothetical protein
MITRAQNERKSGDLQKGAALVNAEAFMAQTV